jgi:hypothetical protein
MSSPVPGARLSRAQDLSGISTVPTGTGFGSRREPAGEPAGYCLRSIRDHDSWSRWMINSDNVF